MNIASINLHGYYNKNVFLHKNFALSDMNEFWTWLAKM